MTHGMPVVWRPARRSGKGCNTGGVLIALLVGLVPWVLSKMAEEVKLTVGR